MGYTLPGQEGSAPSRRSEAPALKGEAMRPVASNEGLLVRELAGELVVYDLERHEAHCLNRTAAFVFKQCDGRSSVAEIASRLQAEFGAHADEDDVWQALEQLDGARLLAHVPTRPRVPSGFSRRDVVRRVGLGLAVAVPVVSSILVPTPAEAAVTCVNATTCLSNVGMSCSVSSPALCDGTCTCRTGGTCTGNCCDLTNQPCSY